MIKLYQFVTSPFCAKIRKILDYKGLDTEIIEVDYLERKELITASGQLEVPVLTLESGETIVGSEKIATRLEELYPEPTILPTEFGGLHLALSQYFEGELGDALFRAAMPDLLEHYRRLGPERLLLWKFIRERKYGAGFCDSTAAEHRTRLSRALEMLRPLDVTLDERAFLMGRIGLADFSLYGQLCYLALSGKPKIPTELVNLRAFFERIGNLSAKIEITAN